MAGRIADAIGQLFGLSGLLKLQLDQLGFCMRDCANAQREGKGVDEEGFNRHGLLEWMVGGVAPRLLQDHSPSGELPCTALVQKPRSSGESLVIGLEEFSWSVDQELTPFDSGYRIRISCPSNALQ